MAAKGINPGDVHPVYKAMNQLDYDVGNIGNHEFNYGLDFLQKTLKGANFPYINANVFDKQTGEHYFKPYLIKTHTFKDTNGEAHQIKVGYIGFVPPQIMVWDKKNLEGKVFAKDIKETAKAEGKISPAVSSSISKEEFFNRYKALRLTNIGVIALFLFCLWQALIFNSILSTIICLGFVAGLSLLYW
ncbi:hypothetical protein P3590_26905, partial [Vibrio parahaemolyticus]|nr:hypothetical protein [Vibrio parahaemolyticus]